MQFLLAEGILFGLTGAQVALMIAVVAIIFALRRWRQVVAHRRAIDARGMKSYEEIERRSPTPPAPTANPLNVREVATELSALLADLEETARRVAAQIDNRGTGLEILLREADEKIKRLEELTRAAAGNTGNTATPLAAPPKTPALIGTAIDAAKTLSRLRQERGAPIATEDPAYQPIFQLADRGKSAREIAQELGRQPGEVELILALRGRQRVG